MSPEHIKQTMAWMLQVTSCPRSAGLLDKTTHHLLIPRRAANAGEFLRALQQTLMAVHQRERWRALLQVLSKFAEVLRLPGD